MKRIGLIARADNTGLGIQSKEFFDHIPCKALVIDSSGLMSLPLLHPRLSRFPGQQVYRIQQDSQGILQPINRDVIEEFLRDLDVVFAMETPYDYNIFSMCRQRGIKTVLQFNYEFLEYPSYLPKPDLFAAPSMWHYENVPGPKMYLPVPVNAQKFLSDCGPGKFLHIVGRMAYNDRNGTQNLMNALRYVQNKITLTVRGQQPVAVPVNIPNVEIITDWSDKEEYQDNYVDGGVLILPRKFGGLSLPMNEALASMMPIIATDISPNNQWLPQEWLVKAEYGGNFMCRQVIDYFEADPYSIAQKIDQFCDPAFYAAAVDKAVQLKNTLTWDNLLPLYHQTFENL